MTINLENRKKIDFQLIKTATEKKPRTFTELLHITRLPRKTLSLRLKELCEKGFMIKESGMYKLNGISEFSNPDRNLSKGFLRVFNDKKIKTSLMLLTFLASFSACGYVLATLFATANQSPLPNPVILGNFTMALEVNDVEDLSAWQVTVTFNSSELKVIEIIPGGFVGSIPVSEDTDLNTTDLDEGIFLSRFVSEDELVLGGCLLKGPGRSGSGRLAILVFGYYVEEYKYPRIEEKEFENYLANSKGLDIPVEKDTLTLTILEKP
jgi:hypothetical protein